MKKLTKTQAYELGREYAVRGNAALPSNYVLTLAALRAFDRGVLETLNQVAEIKEETTAAGRWPVAMES